MTEEKKELITMVDEAPLAGETPFAIRTKDQAMSMAKFLAQSSLIPKPLQGKPSDVLIVMMGAEDLNITPFRALQSFAVIQGRLTMGAELMRALVARSPVCEYLRQVTSSDTEATFETKRTGHPEPTSYTYTLNDAKVAGLLIKDNWKKHPKEMLLARASSGLCRQVYPDLLAGIIYTPEEVAEGGIEIKDVTPDLPTEGTKEDKLATMLGAKPAEEIDEVVKDAAEREDKAYTTDKELPTTFEPEEEDQATKDLDAAIQGEEMMSDADIRVIKEAMGKEMTMEELELFLSGRYSTRLLVKIPRDELEPILGWIETNVAQTSLLGG